MVFSYIRFAHHSSSASSTTRLMIFQVIIVLILSTTTTVFSQYNSGIQYSAYSGGHEFPSHHVEYIDSTLNKAQESKSEGRSSKRDQARSSETARSKQVDESMVAQMLNNPNAMKMVLNYLTKQNLKDHQNKWNKMSQTKNNGKSKNKKKKPVTTKIPKRTTTTKKPKTKSPILQITQIKRRNDDGGKSKDKKEQQKNKRRPRPPGGDFFDLAQLFKQLSNSKVNNRKKSQKGAENKNQQPADLSFLFGRPPPPRNRPPPNNRRPHQKPTPPPNAGNLNNPQLMGNKPKLDMFGPSDFVPTHPYSLPMKQHGPMKLTYMSASEFPNIPKYGLIPIPRK